MCVRTTILVEKRRMALKDTPQCDVDGYGGRTAQTTVFQEQYSILQVILNISP